MKNIEIITTQNVVLQYELATLQDRVMAFILDIICVIIFFSFSSGIIAAIFSYSETAQSVALVFLVSLFCTYSLILEYFNNGRSIGKMIMKIQVTKLSAGKATFSDLAARWAFRLVDIYFSIGGVASILIMSSAKAQRIGDIIANTAVVKTKPKVNIDLQDLLSIHNTSKYKPKYLQARKLQEQDALLIKTTLERYRRFRNDAHYEAVLELTECVREVLGFDQTPEDPQIFLQTVLQDYVVLSR